MGRLTVKEAKALEAKRIAERNAEVMKSRAETAARAAAGDEQAAAIVAKIAAADAEAARLTAALPITRTAARAARQAEAEAPVVETTVSVPVLNLDSTTPAGASATGMIIAALERGVDVEARMAAYNEEELSEEDDW